MWIWDDPVKYAIHQPLVRSAGHALRSFDWPLLRALVGPGGYLPDFLTPRPGTARPDIEDELAVLRSTAPEVVIDGLMAAANGQALHPRLRAVHHDPTGLLGEIVDGLKAYWELVLAPFWPRLSAVLESDILFHAKRMATHGMRGLLRDFDQRVAWSDGTLVLDEPGLDLAAEVNGRGLVFTPSLFCNRVVTLVDCALPPRIWYPARGRGNAWSSDQAASSPALSDLLGRTRARLLVLLAAPASTTELAFRTGMSQGAVNEQLGVLVRAGLAEKSRSGHLVLYSRSRRGDLLAQ